MTRIRQINTDIFFCLAVKIRLIRVIPRMGGASCVLNNLIKNFDAK
jgi:hypothetical protein